MSDAEKGKAIGYIIGKYGTDIFACSASVQVFSTFRKLQQANRACTFEAMAANKANKKLITAKATEFAEHREQYFKNAKIHWGKQLKHDPTHSHFIPGGGKVTISKERLEYLAKKHVGKGQPVGKKPPFSAGYKERIDFGEIIGEHACTNGSEVIYTPTTKGIVHYSKDSIHIVPAEP